MNRGLYYTSLLLDLIAIVLALKISLLFSGMILLYGLVSKAYSHPSVRLKKYPIWGWLTTGFFQGFFSFLMCYEGINTLGLLSLLKPQILVPAFLSSLILWGSYPMTQIYQHEEDRKHGDNTLSMVLGVRGTFVFTSIFFMVSVAGFLMYFDRLFEIKYGVIFLGSLLPVLIYFLIWFYQISRDFTKVNHSRTMWLNFISAVCLNCFFVYFFLDTTQVLQAIKSGY